MVQIIDPSEIILEQKDEDHSSPEINVKHIPDQASLIQED
jgi:hypothetical protein